MTQLICHLDLDAFFAAVEELDRPELAARPLIVAGDPHGRGVVATANYHARRYGVRSGMSAAEAYQRCPSAVFVAPRGDRYREVSAAVWTLVRAHVATVEQVGIDEGYLLLEAASVEGCVERARALQDRLAETVGVSCSLGIATTKVVAKVASDREKPRGLVVVRPGEERAFFAPLPVGLLPGVGPKTSGYLQAVGIRTLGELAALDDAQLAALLPGKNGAELHRRSRGIDSRIVDPVPAERKSVGHEETFAVDVDDRDALRGELRRVAERVAARLSTSRRAGRTITVKIRYADFTTLGRSRTLRHAVEDADTISAIAVELLDETLDARPGALRLVGISVSGLTWHLQLRLPLEDA